MANAKQVTVQAKINGVVVFDGTVSGKANRHALLVECMRHIDTIGGNAIIRTQTGDARSFARYRYSAGDAMAYFDQSAEF